MRVRNVVCFCLAWLVGSCPAVASTGAQTAEGQATEVSVTSNKVHLRFPTATGCSYYVQSRAELEAKFWRDAVSDLRPNGLEARVVLPRSGPQAFFRVLACTNRIFWYDWTYYYEQPVLTDWGLGKQQDMYVQVDRPYAWYIDQADTGPASNNNCGPSSTVMAIKWYNPEFTGSAAEARQTYPAGGGWWYTSDVVNYLDLWSVPRTVSAFTGTNQLVQVLSAGQLVILCINTSHLSWNDKPAQRVGRFYGYASGHILVLKGWRVMDGALWFEVYDPNNWHAFYEDKTPKGRNRHLLAAELTEAIRQWWNYLIVVHPPTADGEGGRNGVTGLGRASRWLLAVDPKRIVHQGGM
jgi:hypothetical protein